MKILIVDDREEDRVLMRYALERQGWRITEAADGAEALALLRLDPPDLVISDALMPKMDGFGLLRAMKQEPGLAGIPFIFYTATYNEQNEYELAMSLGAAALLAKPLPPDELARRVVAIVANFPKPGGGPGAALVSESERLLERYSTMVATKLEEKVRELELAKETWEKTFNALRDVVTVQDKEMRILRANQAAACCAGQEAGALIGRTCHEVFRGNREPCPDCPLQLTVQDGQSHSGVIINGSTDKTFHVTSTPVFDQGGQVEYLIHVARDITEERRLEEELRQAHKMEAIGTLAGGIAHDFNNILAAILGYAELAQHKLLAGQDPDDYLKEVITAGLRAKELVRQILTFSRKGGQTVGPMTPYPLVKEALKFLRSSLPSTVVIKEDIDPQSGALMADPTKLHQVVVNLCTNAFQAMVEEKGVLSISLKRREWRELDTALRAMLAAGPYMELVVRDDGEGIRPEDLPHIFEPYFTTKETGKGTGLGLAVAHGIVYEMGGMIRVESEPGQGAAFLVYLPALPLKEENAGAPFTAQARLLPGTERVLVVDDDPALTAMLGGMLERLGYRVAAFNASDQALAAFTQAPDNFDLLISDQTMPQITGAELVQAIHRLRPDLPVIICTGFSAVLSEGRAKELGISRYLQKPVGLQELTRAMREALEEKGRAQG